MPLTAEQRRVRARNAADARHHPGADPGDLDRDRFDRHVDEIGEIVARAGKMTPGQAARIGSLFRYLDPDDAG